MSFYKFFKRAFDIILSLIFIILLFPFFIFFAIFCAIDTKASPFFLQERIGKNSKPFKIIKFRTMKKSAPEFTPERDFKNPDDYVSKRGAWMRKTGFDELPQLFNILMGKMSIVGPRPLMITEGRLHKEREFLGVYNVRPGLTGLAQIKCDTITSVEEKATLDFEYTTKMSLIFDAKLIFLTVKRFVSGKHIDEHFTSPLS